MHVRFALVALTVGIAAACSGNGPARPDALDVVMPTSIDVVVPGWVPEDLVPMSVAEVWRAVQPAVAQRFVDGDRQMIVVHERRPYPYLFPDPPDEAETAPRPEALQWSSATSGSGRLSWFGSNGVVFVLVTGMSEDDARAAAAQLRLRSGSSPAGYDLARSSDFALAEELQRPGGVTPEVSMEWSGPGDRRISVLVDARAPEWARLTEDPRPTTRRFGDLEVHEVSPGAFTLDTGPSSVLTFWASGLTDDERDRVIASMGAASSDVLQRLAEAVSERLATQPLLAAGQIDDLALVGLPSSGATVEMRAGEDESAALCLVTADRRVCARGRIGAARRGSPTNENPAASWHVVVPYDRQAVLIGVAPTGADVVVSRCEDQPDIEPVLHDDGSGRVWLATALPTDMTSGLWQEGHADGTAGAELAIPRFS